MNNRQAWAVILTVLSLFLARQAVFTASGSEELLNHGMVLIPGGVYQPFFKGENDAPQREVHSYLLQKYPVTCGEYLEFVQANPKWKRSKVIRLFADEQYLADWKNDEDPGIETPGRLNQPVTWVSWFAARAYAKWKGMRLPTSAEWEFAAQAGFDSVDGSGEPAFVRDLMKKYSLPLPEIFPQIGQERPNFYGLHDMHGLAWEWTLDFNSALATGDVRNDTGINRVLFCGAGALGTVDRSNYAAYMRYGFRSSVKASYTIRNLGFRCAKDCSKAR